MRPVIRGILLDIAPALIAYYGLRALGVSEYIALLSATVLAGGKVVYDALRARKLDPFAGYLMVNFGLSLAVGAATSDARMLMVGDTLVGGIGGVLFLGSCVIGTPLTYIVAERVQSAGVEHDDQEKVRKRAVHVRLSLIWGVGLLLGMGVSLGVIFSFCVDVAKAASTAVSLVVTGILILLTMVVARAARRGRPAERAHAETGSDR